MRLLVCADKGVSNTRRQIQDQQKIWPLSKLNAHSHPGLIIPAAWWSDSNFVLGAARSDVIRRPLRRADGMTVVITRTDVSAAELRRVAGRSSDAAAARRMLAIALVLEGYSRSDAAGHCGMDRQTLRDWVHRFNAAGIAGLSNRPHGGGA